MVSPGTVNALRDDPSGRFDQDFECPLLAQSGHSVSGSGRPLPDVLPGTMKGLAPLPLCTVIFVTSITEDIPRLMSRATNWKKPA